MTTHTPMLARYLPETDLRFIQRSNDGARTVSEGSTETSAEIAKSLGVLPDHNVKIFIGVEGPNDINFLKGMAQLLFNSGENVPNLDQLELDGEIIFFPFGGSNLSRWASRLVPLNRPEFHICDRDNEPPALPKYVDHVNAVNGRDGCRAVITQKREMENYVHQEAVLEAYNHNGINVAFAVPFADFDDVPTIVAEAVHTATAGNPWEEVTEEKRRTKISKAKHQINSLAVARMTVERLAQTNPNNEIRGWLAQIGQMIAEG